MNYWLLKSEPNAYSIDDLQAEPNQMTHWDGVRNYQARNMLRDQLRAGDLAFFYHSSCPVPGIVGVVEVVKAGYPDQTAFDCNAEHYDPKSDPQQPRWFMVDIQLKQRFKQIIALEELKQYPQLSDMILLRKGNRLSVMPVTLEQWQCILSLRG